MLPSFHWQNFPFLIDYGTISELASKLWRKQSDSFDLVNVKTGHRQPLIYGSAQNDQFGRQRAAYITNLGNDSF